MWDQVSYNYFFKSFCHKFFINSFICLGFGFLGFGSFWTFTLVATTKTTSLMSNYCGPLFNVITEHFFWDFTLQNFLYDCCFSTGTVPLTWASCISTHTIQWQSNVQPKYTFLPRVFIYNWHDFRVDSSPHLQCCQPVYYLWNTLHAYLHILSNSLSLCV